MQIFGQSVVQEAQTAQNKEAGSDAWCVYKATLEASVTERESDKGRERDENR